MDELQTRPNVATLAELRELLGPPPVLSTENAKAYDEIEARLMECHAPEDFMMQLFIHQLTVCTWEMMRITRQKPWAIERKFRQLRQFQAQRAKAATQNRDPQLRGLAQSDRKPTTELGRMLELEDVVDNAVHDVDEILNRAPEELDHARAFEATIVYLGQLDQLYNAAVARRNDVLAQIERYRHGLGRRLRKASDEIINAEFNEAEQESKQVCGPACQTTE
jgi:hypothetical protein